jgi:ATP sulfurylase
LVDIILWSLNEKQNYQTNNFKIRPKIVRTEAASKGETDACVYIHRNVMHRPVYGVQPTPAKDGDEYQRFPLITIRRL